MHLGLRVLLVFFLLCGLTAYALLRVVLGEVKPSVREVVEESLVETANLVAVLSAEALQAGGELDALSLRLQELKARSPQAQIWGLKKDGLDLRIYLTDARGRVLLDTATPSAVGQDYSRWNDVLRTLRGEYGARASRTRYDDEGSLVLQVAAPVRNASGQLIGVASVGKPVAALDPFIARTERRVWWIGVALVLAALAMGGLLTGWLVWTVRRLRDYALQVQAGAPLAAPQLQGELGQLARAMDAMRLRLEGRSQWEQRVRALTHELKSPITALRGAGELLHEELAPADRERFARQVVEQSERLQALVERLLELSKLEAQTAPARRERLRLDQLLHEAAAHEADRCQQRGLRVQGLDALPEASLLGDPEALALLLANLLGNAIDFAPAGSTIELALQPSGAQWQLTLRDHGPGVPPAAQERLGEQFFSTTRPDGRKGSGLGLALARQVAALHQGGLVFEPAEPGLRVRLTLPSHSP